MNLFQKKNKNWNRNRSFQLAQRNLFCKNLGWGENIYRKNDSSVKK